MHPAAPRHGIPAEIRENERERKRERKRDKRERERKREKERERERWEEKERGERETTETVCQLKFAGDHYPIFFRGGWCCDLQMCSRQRTELDCDGPSSCYVLSCLHTKRTYWGESDMVLRVVLSVDRV